MSSWEIRTLRRVATDLSAFRDGRRISFDVVDAFVICLQLVYRELIALEHFSGFDARQQLCTNLLLSPPKKNDIWVCNQCTLFAAMGMYGSHVLVAHLEASLETLSYHLTCLIYISYKTMCKQVDHFTRIFLQFQKDRKTN